MFRSSTPQNVHAQHGVFVVTSIFVFHVALHSYFIYFLINKGVYVVHSVSAVRVSYVQNVMRFFLFSFFMLLMEVVAEPEHFSPSVHYKSAPLFLTFVMGQNSDGRFAWADQNEMITFFFLMR